ncbi:hypothetical protein HDU76_012579 [Blyttiomyces sp. JEL0837]|nr:hypothetical protein HDU76_012579 [Blyttiomyces sp. JEL0837]
MDPAKVQPHNTNGDDQAFKNYHHAFAKLSLSPLREMSKTIEGLQSQYGNEFKQEMESDVERKRLECMKEITLLKNLHLCQQIISRQQTLMDKVVVKKELVEVDGPSTSRPSSGLEENSQVSVKLMIRNKTLLSRPNTATQQINNHIKIHDKQQRIQQDIRNNSRFVQLQQSLLQNNGELLSAEDANEWTRFQEKLVEAFRAEERAIAMVEDVQKDHGAAVVDFERWNGEMVVLEKELRRVVVRGVDSVADGVDYPNKMARV